MKQPLFSVPAGLLSEPVKTFDADCPAQPVK